MFIFNVIIFFLLINTTYVNALDCYSCKQSDENCINDATKVSTINCDGKCATYVDSENKLSRGCAPTVCQENCRACDENKCNIHNVCKSCDSSQNLLCSQSDGSSVNIEICDSGSTKCLINVKSDKHTERRCVKNNEETCKNDDTCKMCSGGNCNIGLFPTNRIYCYQCKITDTQCSSLASNSAAFLTPCVLYDADDKCYTFGTSANSMVRGCVSDLTDNKCKTPESNELCATCSSNNCNSQNYEDNQNLKCIVCNSKDDSKCLWSQEKTNAKECNTKIQYNKKGLCYTQRKENVLYRGCFYDRETTLGECTSEADCTTCDISDGCNNIADFKCIVCRSDADLNCWDKATAIGGSKCSHDVTESTSSCFHGIWNNIAIRGCMVDASVQVQALCKDENNKQCNVCKTENCNTEKSAATSVIIHKMEFFLIYIIMILNIHN